MDAGSSITFTATGSRASVPPLRDIRGKADVVRMSEPTMFALMLSTLVTASPCRQLIAFVLNTFEIHVVVRKRGSPVYSHRGSSIRFARGVLPRRMLALQGGRVRVLPYRR